MQIIDTGCKVVPASDKYLNENLIDATLSFL